MAHVVAIGRILSEIREKDIAVNCSTAEEMLLIEPEVLRICSVTPKGGIVSEALAANGYAPICKNVQHYINKTVGGAC